MGGKNPTIVLADADFNTAVENTVNAAFFSTGQKCTATSRVIVEEGIYNKFVDAMVERTKKLKVGNGMEPGIDIGPAVDEGQLETNLKYIEIGKKESGKPKVGGNRLERRRVRQGLLLSSRRSSPMSTEKMTLAQEEIFGPVLAVMPAKNLDDAMRDRQQHSVRTLRVDPDHQSLARVRLHLQDGSRPADRQSAERRCRVSTAVRRHQGFELRSEGTGSGGARVLQRLQDRLPEVLIATAFASAADLGFDGARKITRHSAGETFPPRSAKGGPSFSFSTPKLPGKPDFVLQSRRLAVFVDGDFWHGRQWHSAQACLPRRPVRAERIPRLLARKDPSKHRSRYGEYGSTARSRLEGRALLGVGRQSRSRQCALRCFRTEPDDRSAFSRNVRSPSSSLASA